MAEGEGGNATLLKDVIPQDLHGREYLKHWLDKPASDKAVLQEVFKKLDNAESFIGKRPQIPSKDAPEAEWDKFLSGLRPDKAEDYVVPTIEGVKLDERGTRYQAALRNAMHKAGVPKTAAEKFFKEMQAFGIEDQKDFAAKAKAEQDKAKLAFETAAKAALGDKRDEIMARVRTTIDELAPAAFKQRFAKLDDEVMVTVAGVVNAVLEKYLPADKLSARPGDSTKTEQDEEASLDAEGKKLQASAEYKDQFHAEHEKVRARLKAIFTRIAEIREEKKKKK